MTAAQSPNLPPLDIGRCFNEAIEVYRRNFWVLVLAAFLFQMMSVLTLLILCGPLSGGVCLMSLRAMSRPDKRIDLGDLFAAMGRFLPLMILLYLTLIPILIGFALLLVPGLLLMTMWLYAFYFMADRRLGIFDSLSASWQTVRERGFTMHLLLALLCLVLSGFPYSARYLGPILSWILSPLAWLLVASAYRQVVGQGEDSSLHAFPVVPIPPAPPGQPQPPTPPQPPAAQE